MLRLSYEEIIDKIVNEKGVSKEDIEEKIEVKINELSDLISKEGAAHIIANQYGIKLFENNAPKDLKISKIPKGVNGINVLGKLISVFEIREFKTEKRQGRLGFCTIGDETGSMRLVVWDDKILDKVNEISKEGDIIKVGDAYSKENNGYIELHLGSRGKLDINPEGETVGEVKTTSFEPSFSKKKINELSNGERVELQGTIVQVFDPRYYDVCEKCNRKVFQQDGKATCNDHGEVSPKKAIVLNFFFDDATSNIRVVCFADLAEKIISKTGQELSVLEPIEVENVTKGLLGFQFVIKGRVTKNVNFDRLELIANFIDPANPVEIIESFEK